MGKEGLRLQQLAQANERRWQLHAAQHQRLDTQIEKMEQKRQKAIDRFTGKLPPATRR